MDRPPNRWHSYAPVLSSDLVNEARLIVEMARDTTPRYFAMSALDALNRATDENEGARLRFVALLRAAYLPLLERRTYLPTDSERDFAPIFGQLHESARRWLELENGVYPAVVAEVSDNVRRDLHFLRSVGESGRRIETTFMFDAAVRTLFPQEA